MALFPLIRPKVGLYVQPPELIAGQPVELRVRVDAPRPRKVERIDLWVEQRVRSTQGIGSRFRHHAQLSGPRTLPKGVTQLVAKAVMPPHALPDHRGQRISVTTVVHVALQTRWRLDVNRSFQLRVRGASHDGPVQPLLFSSREVGREGPHLEGSLDRSVLRPGGLLTGRVAAIGANCRSLQVILASTEQDGTGRTQGRRWTLNVDGPLADGASVPFAMSIPERVTPSFQAGLVALGWVVELRADRAFARDLGLRIPVEVALSTADPEHAQAPIVGDERVAALWRHMGRQLGAVFDGRTLRDRVGEVDVTVGSGDGWLEAELAFPSLDIGLEGGEREGLWRLAGAVSSRGKIPELGDRWNELFYATSREPAQAQAFLLQALGQLVAVRFRDASDTSIRLRVEAPRDSGTQLERLFRLARRVAERVPQAAASMPMPVSFEPHRASWEQAASELQARFSPGPPRLEARDGAWRIDTRWLEEGPRTSVERRTTTPIDERLHVAPGEPLPDALSRDARPLAEALAGDGRLQIATDFVLMEREGRVTDPMALEPVLDRLSRLVRLLRVDEGPYR